jgi:hypothetical protein
MEIATDLCQSDEILMSDRTLAVGAGAAGAYFAAEQTARLAAADPEIALRARWAFVDGGLRTGACRRRVGRPCSTQTPIGLLARV